ncbi:MAG TPA: hypothetical protein VE445_11840 [Nitrososphaeraceae archaeon]|jgi:hypothetical protein|nr:hypothetical protein [Nitrososphaeraceae archaeon]
MLLFKEKIKEKMKILAITNVFKTIKNALLFITKDKEKTQTMKRAFRCGSISLLSINKEKP